MTNVEVNNEIVQLRKPVRRASTCVINKLIREAKALHNKQGTEKQVEKNKKRGDKLLREVSIVRTVRDDEISKFGIANLDRLQEIIQDSKTDDKTRAIAKVVKFKPLSTRIAEFREKFPNYRELLDSKKKKKKKKVLVKEKIGKSSPTEREVGKRVKVADVNSTLTLEKPVRKSPRTSKRRKSETEDSCESDGEDHLEKEHDSNKQNKNKQKKTNKERTNLKKTPDTSNPVKHNAPKPVKVISKQATVKRFTEILQQANTSEPEATSTEDSSCSEIKDTLGSSGEAIESSGVVDDFFIGPNGTAKITEPPVSWKISSTDSPETRGTSRMRNLKKKKDILGDISGNAGRRRMNVAECKSNERNWREGEPRGMKMKKAAVEPKRRSARQNVENANTADNASLHPSWAARKKQQEIMKQGFQGKKIVFDED